MVKKIFSITFIISSVVLIALAFPLYAGQIEPNTFYGFSGDATLTDAEWIAHNRIYGAGTMAFAMILLAYHGFALVKMRSIATGPYVLRGFLAFLMSLFPAYLVMYILESTL